MTGDFTKQIKRVQIILLLAAAILVFFGSCGVREEDAGQQSPETTQLSENGHAAAVSPLGDTEDAGESMGAPGSDDGEPADAQPQEQPKEVSDRSAEIVWQGDIFYKSLAEVGDDGIYMIYRTDLESDERYMGKVSAEGSQIEEFDFPIEENRFAIVSCTDSQGNWHAMFVESGSYEWSQIWVITPEGELQRTVDISAIRKEYSVRPFYMAIDSEGNYYLDNWGQLLVIDKEGNLKCQANHMDVAGLGTGRSGQVYGIFYQEDSRELYLAKVSAADGSLEPCPGVDFDGLRVKFSSLRPGVNCELLLANREGGAWEYRDGELIKVIGSDELPCGGQDIQAMGFLNDGRLCVMEYRDGNNVFHYLPAERKP